ncbi:hypothetical protein HNP55_004672 [Paucibacter oligotrophus]|uniref:DUF2917 family protein n=1 Tax=Roseateles oligotrophus TaxID=1769250 RepID=A0A840LIT0_9BURK|nr:DUF2917 domain-containing protein [Roseateles oligotrophus]MBB4846118.1 hypothetical protein [Roseateles oligotrophus]
MPSPTLKHLCRPLVLQLQDGELHRLDGVCLTVLAGRVWVTRSHDGWDHFIKPGAELWLPAGCEALIGGDGAATLRLLPLRVPAEGLAARLAWGLRRPSFLFATQPCAQSLRQPSPAIGG